LQAKLTDIAAKKAGPGLYWDSHPDAPKGFLLRVTPAGARAWCLNYRVKDTGRERRVTIGDCTAWPVAEARKRAAQLRRVVDEGGDPLGQAQERRGAPTVAELAARYIEAELPKRAPGTRAEYRQLIEHHILPALGRLKLSAVTRDDIEKLHRRITEAGTSRRANSVKTMVSILFGRAIAWGLCTSNPASGIEKNPEPGRERYLSPDELDRLMTVLAQWRPRRPDSVDAITLAVLTGARRGEILGSTWQQFDLSSGTWTKPASLTKQRKLHHIPLSGAVVELLQRRLDERNAPDKVVALHRDDHVFPGGTARTSQLEQEWRVIRAAAVLNDVRFHDLRHTHASILVNQGLSLPIIGRLLGHTKPSTTARYSHLQLDPLRAAAELAAEAIRGKNPAR
jgi:integrase